jgi:hypothetical protein
MPLDDKGEKMQDHSWGAFGIGKVNKKCNVKPNRRK